MLKCACNCLQICWNYLLKHHETSLNWNYLEKWSTSTCRNRSNVLQLPSTHPCGDSFLCMFDSLITAYQNSVVCSLHMFKHMFKHNPLDMCRIGKPRLSNLDSCRKKNLDSIGFLQQLPLAHLLIFRSSSLGRPHSTEVIRPNHRRWPWVFPGRNYSKPGPCWDSPCNWWQNSWTSDIIVNPDHLQSSWRTKQKNMFHPSTKDPCVAKFPIFKLLWGFQGPRKLQAAVSQSNFIPVDLPDLVSGNGELLDIEG